MDLESWHHRISNDVIAEGVRLTVENADDVVAWCHGTKVEPENPMTGEKSVGINLTTLEGRVRVNEGDYILCLDGWFHHWTPDGLSLNWMQ